MRRMMKSTLLIFSIFLMSMNLSAQESASDVGEVLDELQKNQQEMRLELQEIKSLLSKLAAQQLQPKPAPQQPPQMNVKGVEFDIGNNPILGRESANLIMVEFSDYQCPFCGRYSRETFPEIKKQYIDSGAIRYVVIDQPLPIHPDAPKAAEAAHCANDQGKFVEMHDGMMAKQEALKDLSSYAKALNLNIGEFESCLNAGKYRDAVSGNMALAKELGMNGVPGFIIGTLDAKDSGKVTGISTVRGAVPLGNFQKEIEAAISANK
jgi:protein-disulfide isomerase